MNNLELTSLLCLFWAPTVLAAGIGIFASPAHYARLYRGLESQSLAVLTIGLIAMNLGLAHVLVFEQWHSLPTALVSLLGWTLLLKGLVLVVAPRVAERAGDWWLDRKLIPYSGIVMIVLGAYLGFQLLSALL